MPVKILKAEFFADFDLLKVKVKNIFFYHRKGTSSHQILRMKIGSAVWAAPVPKSVESFKKHKPLFVGYM